MQKKQTQLKNPAQTTNKAALVAARRRLQKQGALAVFTVMVTVILLFAMTTAWYTNIIETSGLTFEAESWGFEGDVAIQESVVKAAPGDSGVIDLNITNDSDHLTSVTVNVSKEYMVLQRNPIDPHAMQKRIFFYIDEQTVLNGETVNKQYLYNTKGREYTLFSQNTLLLSEDVHTDSLLKWEWVFDMVGYYFRGTVSADGKVTVDEYLQPVVYDPYKATYTSDSINAEEGDPGYLVTVDGRTTVGQFLSKITTTDGFPGSYYISEGKLKNAAGQDVTPVAGCYPVYSDNQQQIWIYLCTKSEIEANTRWDTDFGTLMEGETAEQFQARISVTGQQVQQQVQEISNPDALAYTLKYANGSTVRLEASMILTEPVEIANGESAVLDLNGYGINYIGTGNAFVVKNGGQLTVLNGAIQGEEDSEATAFYTVGGQVTLNNVTISDMYMGVNVEDHKTVNYTQGANSFVRIVDCELDTIDISVKINGDGSLSGEKTHLVIQDSTINSQEYIGVMGNGSATNPGNWGTDIQIINSKVSGYYAGIYHPQQQSKLTISDSEISGMSGIAVKGGDVLIMDTYVTGTGTADDGIQEPTENMLSGSGYVDTGDAIYVETNYKRPISVTVSGYCVIKSASAKCIRVFPEANYVQIQITGGTFGEDISKYLSGTKYTCSPLDGWYVVSAAG